MASLVSWRDPGRGAPDRWCVWHSEKALGATAHKRLCSRDSKDNASLLKSQVHTSNQAERSRIWPAQVA